MKKIAMRYANAFFQLAQTDTDKKKYYQDLGTIKGWMIGSKHFGTLLSNPMIPREISKKMLLDICKKGKASQSLTHFLLLIVDEGRLRILPDIIDAYRTLYQDKNGIEKAEIETAHELTKDMKSTIQKILEERFNTQLILGFKMNKSLLGGFRIQIGSHQIDSSLMAHLTNLSQTLKGAS